MKIRKVLATNSKPTIEVEMCTKKGCVRTSVPFGTSKSSYEVKYLPVDRALQAFSKVKRYFVSEEFDNQREIDETLHLIDKTEDFREIGGNVALAISISALKAFAKEEGIEIYEYIAKKNKPRIPKPLSNMVGGWKGQSDIQEFLLFPIHQESFSKSIFELAEIYWKIGSELALKDRFFKFSKNWESAWVTFLKTEEILNIISKVIDQKETGIGLDVAASTLWDGRRYTYSDKTLSTMEQIEYMIKLAEKYKIKYLEDPIKEDDFVSFATITKNLPHTMVCGDDLYATNYKRLKYGIELKSTNAVLVKPNQIGTVSDTIEFVRLAKSHGMKTILSHRSGETDDTFICHVATGLETDYIKIGISGERIVKINEMIRIEEKINES